MNSLTKSIILISKSIAWLGLVILCSNPVDSVLSQKLLRPSSKFLSPHSNDILIATRNPECDDSHHQTKILILPVFVPHSRKEPEVEIVSMNQYSPYKTNSKKVKKGQWKQEPSNSEERDNGLTLAKFLESPKANYIMGNDFDLNQALMSGKIGNMDANVGQNMGLTSGFIDGGSEGGGGGGGETKMPLLAELLMKSMVAGQKTFDWDYVASNNSPQHSSPEKEKTKNTTS